MTLSPRRRSAHLRRLAAATVAVALGMSWLVSASPTAGAAGGRATAAHACAKVPRGFARCFAEYQQTRGVAPQAVRPNALPPGFGAGDLQDAYNLPTAGGVGRVIAIVDAFDLPDAESELATYRATFGLPPCTSASGCFLKVNQDGDPDPANLPATNAGWAIEIALDLDMVSASCPQCAIVLVEADNNTTGNLATAAGTGASYAEAVSNSYGAQESSNEHSQLDPFYSVPGVVYTAASGDTGYGTVSPAGPQYPAATSDVVAVGGTSLAKDGSPRGWSETVWSNAKGSGNSGCSVFETKPVWQTDHGCAKRTEVDVAADADLLTGVATFAKFGTGTCTPDTEPCWGIAGGTSASAPLIAGAYMVAGGPPVQKAGRLPYDRLAAHMNDVTSGSNGACGTYLCNAQAGYDGPTGQGTPNGVADLRSIAGISDFDSVGNTQFAVYRPSSNTWYVRNSFIFPAKWGTTGDIPVPADYFGDTFTDAAIYRPSTHKWYIQFLQSSPPSWGVDGDIPVPADYNGDGPADIAMYRPSNGTWYVRGVSQVQWGANGDIPVPGDYDGDGKTDYATFRPSNQTWYIRGVTRAAWGKPGDVPVPGDYNGDGVEDIAMYRPSTHTWYVRNIANVSWGASTDAPEPGDYNGDGRTDFATWRPSNGTWYVRGVVSVQWGQSTDHPLVLPYAINRTR